MGAEVEERLQSPSLSSMASAEGEVHREVAFSLSFFCVSIWCALHLWDRRGRGATTSRKDGGKV